MNPPQQVTSRYVRNLIFRGQNNDFLLLTLRRQTTMLDGITVGEYYSADIRLKMGVVRDGIGVTPEQAVHRCLEKHGVTFR